MDVREILRCAAKHRVSLNAAANLIEDRDNAPVSSSDVVRAIEARQAAHGARLAGAYWDACREAALNDDQA